MKKRNYVGHLAKAPRDFNKPNFNLGSRDMVKALINASFENQGGMVTNTHRARLPALKHFISFIKTHTPVKRLNEIEKQHVVSFGEFLKNNADEELLSPATARDYLSHVNRALAQARGDDACVVNATRDLGFTPKSGIATLDGSVKEGLHEKVLPQVTPEVGFVMQLQRTFGVRFREGALLDASRVLEELHRGQTPMLLRGTKGGQSRPLPVDSEEKYRLLVRVAAFLAYTSGVKLYTDRDYLRMNGHALERKVKEKYPELNAYCKKGRDGDLKCTIVNKAMITLSNCKFIPVEYEKVIADVQK
ncbi:integrase domain-containing protein [Vibrio parahaemolyticus]|uniref:integrase domain-containing protein n=1 Tax=Vibrio parahaemolyticus TaxID=670 RepID=UPI0004161F1F|nr:integrase domain-containing protein [Vibrio parahaemolyticus]MBE4049636.1 hypothetical protein [Vibrio parahaemolyticus]TOI40356.1 hypothetical protein CGI60_21500 [Vibrio parahaemolyticus]